MSSRVVQIAAGIDPKVAMDFLAVRRTTEDLCSTLTVEDHMVQSMPDASPAKWHLAHTSWFFETFLLTPHLPGYETFDTEFRHLFNSYYNAVGDRPSRQVRGVFSRPSLEDVREYRKHVDDAMLRFLASPASQPLRNVIDLGFNHEQQHQELIVTDIKHALWSNPLRPVYRDLPERRSANAPPLRWHDFSAGLYEIGHAGDDFCFDNEAPRHKVYLEDFSLASRPVTNGEYLEFIKDCAYDRAELWLSDAWDTVCSQHWRAPLYWEKISDEWWHFTCAGMKKVDLDAPVCHVSYYEADAYARWAGARLPTEAEWETAAQAAPRDPSNHLEEGNFGPIATTETAGNTPQQMFGDVWEWTSSAYAAYPGYRPAEGALGEYNAKFMCNQMVLRGGSCVTPRPHIRASYRNFFPPQVRWQFSGIRLAR